MRLKWTLFRKILLLVVAVLLLTYVPSEIIILELISHSIEKNFYNEVENTSILLQKNTEALFADSANILKFLKGKYENQNREDDLINIYLEALKESIYSVVNLYIAFDDGSYILEPKAYLPEGFDPRERTWYKSALGSAEIKWSQPYIDIVTNDLVLTGSKFVQMKDFSAVFGIDFNLKGLNDIISTTKIGEHGFVILVNEAGVIISESEEGLIEKSISDLGDPEFMDSQIITGSISTSKGLYYIRRLNQTDISLVAFLPKSDLVEARNQIRYFSLAVLSISLIVGLFITYFMSKRITQPLKGLLETMNASKAGSKMELFETRTSDEINSLILAYNSMATSVNEKNGQLKNLSRELVESDEKLHAQYMRTAELAYNDYLTGLPNRVKFEQIVKEMIIINEPFALIYLDLDNFKYINDTYGHNQGDYVLKIISQRLVSLHGGRYFSARLSGDEFGIVVGWNGDFDELESFAKGVLELLSKGIYISNLEFCITGSIGISKYPLDARTFEELLSNADIAMYESKNKSKNQYTIYNESLKNDLVYRFNLETRLVQSIERNELLAYFQPLIDFTTKEITGFEALARWDDLEMGMIYPDIFIPIAEHNLFINKLGKFVLERSLILGNLLLVHTKKYYEMNVNISVVQLHVESFVDDVLGLLKKHNYPAEFLNLEITESVALESDQKLCKKLFVLHQKGVKISLDDFGTGYSSFNHLLNLSLTHLKIDRILSCEATKNKDVYKLVQGIVDFAHNIELIVVAEGIENRYMENLLHQMKIDLAQGFLYAKPMPEKEIWKFIDDYNRTIGMGD